MYQYLYLKYISKVSYPALVCGLWTSLNLMQWSHIQFLQRKTKLTCFWWTKRQKIV